MENRQTPYNPAGTLEGDRPTRASKIINKVIIVALVFVFIALGVMFKWATQNETPLEVKNSPLPTRTIREHPTAGGVIIMTADFCKNTDAVGKLRVSFLSSSREIFQPVVEEKGTRGCAKAEFPILIPADLPPDTYRVKFRATYDINPLKKGIVQEFESKPVIIDPTTPTNDESKPQ